MSDLEVIELTPDLVGEASGLLAQYRFEGGWESTKQEECKEALERLLEYRNAYCLLALYQGKCSGFLSYSWGFSTTKGLPVLRIQDVFTSPNYRRLGVAEALIQRSLEMARQEGAHRIQLETDVDNTPARSLYTKAGFEWIAHKEVYMLPLNRWVK